MVVTDLRIFGELACNARGTHNLKYYKRLINNFDKKEIKKLSAFFMPFLIFVGSLRLILFYNLFGVRIINYLNFTEVLVSFLDTAVFYLFVIFIPIFLIVSFWGNEIGKANNSQFQKKSEMTLGKRIKADFKQNWILIILYVAVFIFAIVKGTWDLQGFLQFILNPGTFIILFILRELRISYKRQFNYNISATYLNLFLLSYLFINVLVQDVLTEYKSITKDFKYIGTSAYFGDEKIISDSTITYVGQTQDYIFFTNLKTKENIIYPKKNLTKIITKVK